MLALSVHRRMQFVCSLSMPPDCACADSHASAGGAVAHLASLGRADERAAGGRCSTWIGRARAPGAQRRRAPTAAAPRRPRLRLGAPVPHLGELMGSLSPQSHKCRFNPRLIQMHVYHVAGGRRGRTARRSVAHRRSCTGAPRASAGDSDAAASATCSGC